MKILNDLKKNLTLFSKLRQHLILWIFLQMIRQIILFQDRMDNMQHNFRLPPFLHLQCSCECGSIFLKYFKYPFLKFVDFSIIMLNTNTIFYFVKSIFETITNHKNPLQRSFEISRFFRRFRRGSVLIIVHNLYILTTHIRNIIIQIT